MFADDTKVARKIENSEDRQKFQKIIDNLARWAKTWEMEFNQMKCKIIHCGNNNPMNDYYMNGNKIEAAMEEKDLGVWVQANMKPAKQCASAAKVANFALGQISRAFHFRKKENLVPLY